MRLGKIESEMYRLICFESQVSANVVYLCNCHIYIFKNVSPYLHTNAVSGGAEVPWRRMHILGSRMLTMLLPLHQQVRTLIHSQQL